MPLAMREQAGALVRELQKPKHFCHGDVA